MSNTLITTWEPENPSFWQSHGSSVATRNLWISIPCLLLAFSVWVLWSIVVVAMPNAGFHFSKDQLFLLTALPALSGATLRIFYSFIVPIVGGRRWTAISTASLLIPALWMGFALADPTTPYPVMVAIALLCGLGGGNFSSSMANISFFFPKAQKGFATGMNAGLGNLGVSLAQFIVPLVISTSIFGALGGDPHTYVKAGVQQQVWLQNAGFFWVPFIVLASFAAWFGMHDLATAKASFTEQAVIFKRKHNWLMCWLYLGTFGSFIGFSAGFALLIKSQFPSINVASYAFLGPLVGAAFRPIGGWVGDKLGGARVTFWTFLLMTVAVFGVMQFLPNAQGGGNFQGFLFSFLALFLLTGLGNGSTFRMIPVIFQTESLRAVEGQGEAAKKQAEQNANKESAAVLGFSAAVGAYGGFFIPKSFGTSIALTGAANAALWSFVGFYLSCLAITWWFYSRKGAKNPC